MTRISPLLILATLILLSGCEQGVPEVWPQTYAEYKAMSEEQKAEIKANCAKHGDFMKGIPLPSCWLSHPKMFGPDDPTGEKQYARKLREWEAYKNAQ
jgi:hypothetical protein